ncbi:MAG: sigma-70 family RNA polymerase sigma factor [Candidatus Eisenbacteria bacterium]|nr:sigma-70 family RNA polymerase sigma factor [Candidatus Eisenbacteria bacterium]
MDRMEERDWIVRCQSGDREAFGPIVEAYRRRAFFTALALVGNREEAYDLSQEAFVRAFHAIARFDPTRDFAPWFFRILRNLCASAHAKRKTRREDSLEEMRAEGRDIPAGDRFSPELLAERNEAAERIWRGLAELDAKHREVVVLKDLQDHSYKEIAEILDIPIGTVMSRLFHARQSLKEKLLGEEARRAV